MVTRGSFATIWVGNTYAWEKHNRKDKSINWLVVLEEYHLNRGGVQAFSKNTWGNEPESLFSRFDLFSEEFRHNG
jgi:hypothetical protein